MIECDLDDTLVVNIHNSLGNETTSIHYYGELAVLDDRAVHQPVYRRIPERHKRYGRSGDGNAMSNSLWRKVCPGVQSIYVAWYHEQMPDILHQYFRQASDFNGKTLMNIPTAPSSLINDTTSITLDMEPGNTYLCTAKLTRSNMTLVAIDGIPTNATLAKAVTVAAGQRNGASGILKYSSKSANNASAPEFGATISIDDFGIAPLDGTKLFSPVEQSITKRVSYAGPKERRIILGNSTYVTPKVPTLYTALTTGSDAWNPEIYGAGANAYIIKSGHIVQIVVQNDDAVEHPMHLHGYDFQVVARGPGLWMVTRQNCSLCP
ncbi:multicopper oxidase [Venturia nashicola]|nr:multicopper oxidase [Venturia nashicola]